YSNSVKEFEFPLLGRKNPSFIFGKDVQRSELPESRQGSLGLVAAVECERSIWMERNHICTPIVKMNVSILPLNKAGLSQIRKHISVSVSDPEHHHCPGIIPGHSEPPH